MDNVSDKKSKKKVNSKHKTKQITMGTAENQEFQMGI